VVDEHIASDADVLAEVGIEGRQQPERLVHRGAGQAPEQGAHLARAAVTRVHLGDDALSLGDQRGDLRVLLVVERDHLASQFALEDVVGGHRVRLKRRQE
jgi:hypothetical protein